MQSMKEAIKEVTQDIEKFLDQDWGSTIWKWCHQAPKGARPDCTKCIYHPRRWKSWSFWTHNGRGWLSGYLKWGVAFVTPNNSWEYSDELSSATIAQQERLLAEHNVQVAEYEKCIGLTNALKLKICEAVESIYLKEIKHPLLDFDEIMPMEILQHLWDYVGDLDYIYTTALKKWQSMGSWKWPHCSIFCKNAKGQRQVGMSKSVLKQKWLIWHWQ